MEFISVSELRIQPGEVWRRLNQSGELVVTSNGKPIALLSSVNNATLEQILTALRRARAQVAVSQLRAASQASGNAKISLDEINTEIKAARRARKPRASQRR